MLSKQWTTQWVILNFWNFSENCWYWQVDSSLWICAGVLWLYVYIGEYHGLYSKRGFSILKQSIIFTTRLIIDLLLQLLIINVSTTGMCNTCPCRDPLFFSVSFLQSLMDCLRQLVELSTFYQYLFITKLGLTLLLPALLTFTVTSIVNREWSAAPLSIVRGHWSITKLSITLLWQIEWSLEGLKFGCSHTSNIEWVYWRGITIDLSHQSSLNWFQIDWLINIWWWCWWLWW